MFLSQRKHDPTKRRPLVFLLDNRAASWHRPYDVFDLGKKLFLGHFFWISIDST